MRERSTGKASAGRLALRRAIWQSGAAVVATAALLLGVDLGAKILDPILIVTGSLAGGIAIRVWWRYLKEEWYAAEIALVTMAWILFGAAFAGLQYFVFTFAPGSFYVDPDYGRLISPRYHREWHGDSARVGESLAQADSAIRLLALGTPARLAVDSNYQLPAGTTVRVVEDCESVLPDECRWRLVVTQSPTAKSFELPIERPGNGGREVSRDHLEGQLGKEVARLRRQIDDLGQRMRNPTAYINPRIGDFLYDTAVAFSGRESGVFSPIGGIARLFKVIESLASYVLFGIVVSRVAAAAGQRLARA